MVSNVNLRPYAAVESGSITTVPGADVATFGSTKHASLGKQDAVARRVQVETVFV